MYLILDPIERDLAHADKGENRHTVLVAEDSKAIMLLYEFLLDQLGCNIIPCYDGLVAWKELNKNCDTVDLIISDIHMPNMDGRELAKRNFLCCPKRGNRRGRFLGLP